MAHSSDAQSSDSKKSIFINEYVSLRRELGISKQQIEQLRNIAANWNLPSIDVLPTTKLVLKESVQKILGFQGLVYITGSDIDNLSFFEAPRHSRQKRPLTPISSIRAPLPAHHQFCHRKPVNKPLCPLYSAYINIKKEDLHKITTIDAPLPMPTDVEKHKCIVCSKRNDNKILQRRLFALPCGHFACRSCWLLHCKRELEKDNSPIPCISRFCTEKLTINRAGALLSNTAIGIMVAAEWRNKIRTGTLRCASCKRWMERVDFIHTVRCAGCECGFFTCVKCGAVEHAPLNCRDAKTWRDMRETIKEDAASDIDESWSLGRDQIEECQQPTKALESEQIKKNLRFMKQFDKKHGRLLERDLPMIARILEMRRVQQLADRKELEPTHECYYGKISADQRWQNLEECFFRALDTVGETKEKDKELHLAREQVLYYYNYYNFDCTF